MDQSWLVIQDEWAIRMPFTSIGPQEPLQGADDASLMVPGFVILFLSLSLSFSLSFSLYSWISLSLVLSTSFFSVLFPSLPCGLHPSGWHAGCRPYPSHNISPPAIRGLTALRSPGNCFGCERNFKHQVPPEFSLPLSLSLSLFL